MPKESDFSGPQFRADRPKSSNKGSSSEAETVRTTIVGGRPPGGGRDLGPIPRGIEVLVKKAAVDPDFRELLLTDSDKACQAIGLEIEPFEAAMLKAVGREQLVAVVDRTQVPDEHRRAFLGKTAAAMLAILAAGGAGIAQAGEFLGAPGAVPIPRPDRKPPSKLDRLKLVLLQCSNNTPHTPSSIKADTKLVDDLELDIDKFQAVRHGIKSYFGVLVPVEDHNRPFDHYQTVSDLLDEVELKTGDGRLVIAILAKQFRVEAKTISTRTRLVEDLKATRSSMDSIRTQVTQQLRVALPAKEFSNAKTVQDLMDIVVTAKQKRDNSKQRSRGVRPDVPQKPNTKYFGLRVK